MSEATVTRRLAAILAADVAGYSRLMAADEAGTLARFKLLRTDHLEPAIRNHGGRVVGEAGDSLLVEFASASEAVTCAVEVQDKLGSLNAELPQDRRMRFRIGVNLGEVIADGATIHGDGVNVAARLEKLAEPGRVVVARAVHDQVKGRLPHRFEDLGERTLHNIAEPVRIYRIAIGTEEPRRQGSESERATIAVLPFTNMSGDPEQEYFSDGITEDLITALAKFRHLSVVARNSTFAYKGKSTNVRDIGKGLGARYVVEGSVRKAGSRVRVTAQLIDASDGTHLWAEKFDRELTDVFAVQDDVVHAIAARVPGNVINAAATLHPARPRTDVTAYDYYLRGIAAWRRGDDADTLANLVKAVEVDPSHAATHGWLAFYYGFAIVTGSTGKSEDVLEALTNRHIEEAIAASKDDPVMHAELGTAYFCLGNLAKAQYHLERARELNPHGASTIVLLGSLQLSLGRHEEGLRMIERGLWLDPQMAPIMRESLFEAHYVVRDYASAVADFARLEAPYPHHYVVLAAALAQLGRAEEAAKAVASFRARCPPGYGIDRLARYYTRVFVLPQDREHWLEGLRKAGLLA